MHSLANEARRLPVGACLPPKRMAPDEGPYRGAQEVPKRPHIYIYITKEDGAVVAWGLFET